MVFITFLTCPLRSNYPIVTLVTRLQWGYQVTMSGCQPCNLDPRGQDVNKNNLDVGSKTMSVRSVILILKVTITLLLILINPYTCMHVLFKPIPSDHVTFTPPSNPKTMCLCITCTLFPTLL